MFARNLVLVGLFTLAVWGQTSDKVLYFTHLDTPQAIQEVTNVVRSVADVRDTSADTAKRSLTVKGTSDQIAMASWLTAELDKTGSTPGTRDLPFNDARAPLAQIYYLTNVDNPRDLQNLVNACRSIVDIQRFFPMSQQRAIVMRGLPEQVKAADWLLGILDQPANGKAASALSEYHLPPADWNARSGLVIQVAAVPNFDTPQTMQEAVNLIRSVADIQRCFPINFARFLVIRGDDAQIALADWLMKRLEGPAGQGVQEFKVGGAGNQVAQVAYLKSATPQSLQETVNDIRTQTQILRVYPFNPQGAVALRGTADQVARAQQVIQSKNGQ